MWDEGGGMDSLQHARILVLLHNTYRFSTHTHTKTSHTTTHATYLLLYSIYYLCWIETLSITGLINSLGTKSGGTIGRRQ